MSIRDYFLQGSGLFRIAQVVLNNNEIKALPTTPLVVVPAPGSGKLLVFDKSIWHRQFAVLYDLPINDSTMEITYGNNEINASESVADQAYMNGGPGEFVTFLNAKAPGRSGPPEDFENKALTIASDQGDNYVGGGVANILTVTVLYAILDL